MAVIVGVLYYALAIVICLPPQHQALLRGWIARKISRPRYVVQPT